MEDVIAVIIALVLVGGGIYQMAKSTRENGVVGVILEVIAIIILACLF